MAWTWCITNMNYNSEGNNKNSCFLFINYMKQNKLLSTSNIEQNIVRSSQKKNCINYKLKCNSDKNFIPFFLNNLHKSSCAIITSFFLWQLTNCLVSAVFKILLVFLFSLLLLFLNRDRQDSNALIVHFIIKFEYKIDHDVILGNSCIYSFNYIVYLATFRHNYGMFIFALSFFIHNNFDLL